MIPEVRKDYIKRIWDNYVATNKPVLDTKGNAIDNIDQNRIKAIQDIKLILKNFRSGIFNVYEFKTSLDSYNKRNNLWGFTATKGQMFFNHLTKTNEQGIEKLTVILKQTIDEPRNLEDALNKIDMLDSFVSAIFSKASDKRKAPNPGSVGYFLSYFWQIHNHERWPIIYTSLINAYTEIGIWTSYPKQRQVYDFFYNLNEDIKEILSDYAQRSITNWEAEHAFWNHSGNPHQVIKKDRQEIALPSNPLVSSLNETAVDITAVKASFEIDDYLIPKVAKLVELGSSSEKSSSTKGHEYEKLVAEIFKQLDFEIEVLGQGSGRNPDVIVKYREGNTAFVVDAKAYSNGYSLGLDDRAIKEYIGHHCPKLQKEGYKKIGFIIVSNSFKSNFDAFINDITWNTEIKRFILLTSEALLYLLAYKTKDKLTLASIIESVISFGNIVTSQDVIEEFDDV